MSDDFCRVSGKLVYHPDPEINDALKAEAVECERSDLHIGYQPREWVCDCGASHKRGHFMGTIGVHRCLKCGYVGDGGIMVLPDYGP